MLYYLKLFVIQFVNNMRNKLIYLEETWPTAFRSDGYSLQL